MPGMREGVMKRCTKCILPETYPDIVYDGDGVCHKCREHERTYLRRNLPQLEKELQAIAGWAKAQKKKYDCIVPFSGGKDSAYTIYVCRKKLGLSVLAVNFNNGLRTPEALLNMENITQKTGAALASFGPSWDVMRTLYREFFLKTGQFCFPCDMGIWATVHLIAEKFDVPLIVSGFSAQIESRGPKIYSYNNHLFRTIAQSVAAPDTVKDFLADTTLQKVARRLKHFRLTRYRRQISLPDYMVWDDAVIKDTIFRELGWGKRSDGSSDHIDCLFAPMKNFLVTKKWGFGEKTTKACAMVRAGQISRDDALKIAAQEEQNTEPPVLGEFMDKLGLTRADIENAKTKSHLDYL